MRKYIITQYFNNKIKTPICIFQHQKDLIKKKKIVKHIHHYVIFTIVNGIPLSVIKEISKLKDKYWSSEYFQLLNFKKNIKK